LKGLKLNNKTKESVLMRIEDDKLKKFYQRSKWVAGRSTGSGSSRRSPVINSPSMREGARGWAKEGIKEKC
jgi:hypothetical protein